MKDPKAIIFDLDGTLLDTIADIASAVNKVLQEFNLPTHSLDSYKLFVGEGIEILVQKVLPAKFKNESYAQILKRITDEYEKGLLLETKPYPGIPELLAQLSLLNIPFAVLSNKPEKLTQLSVAKLLPQFPFKAVWGARPDLPLKPNPQRALMLAQLFGVSASSVFLIGDSEIDILTARQAGMKAVAVSWGFRWKRDLALCHPDWLLDSPHQIIELLNNHS